LRCIYQTGSQTWTRMLKAGNCNLGKSSCSFLLNLRFSFRLLTFKPFLTVQCVQLFLFTTISKCRIHNDPSSNLSSSR
jgi:hypothetical protein